MTSSSTSASPISSAPSKNSVTSRYSRSGVISTMPYGVAVGIPASRIDAQRVVLVLDEAPHATGTAPRPRAARRGACDRACTNGRPARGSSRRASRTGRCRGRRATRRRSGVEPPEPARPTGLISTTVSPSWSCDRLADRVTAPSADVEVRGLALAVARPGTTSLGVKNRNAFSRIADASDDAGDDVERVVGAEVQTGHGDAAHDHGCADHLGDVARGARPQRACR